MESRQAYWSYGAAGNAVAAEEGVVEIAVVVKVGIVVVVAAFSDAFGGARTLTRNP
ncbi:hypothetical protein GV794_10790 [Nocardia cyriacigeorgica]|uniref:Uncharacterized protein n=1 Tax=Nocardia cyriacigeorgica TaxID=135487 RepID=A0A6P1D4V5_9NOCA|nr:hypothetical protein [Nocardia cyriacigeorgica]NEW45645.1 hypothetical protein [Nocardia cyriacigeorgica]NEW48862.1 hypothetical protein [Nocardia cyriacigeorgica]NEW56135.1 hypothetical protein [Nocardia cyriacigeorgica]